MKMPGGKGHSSYEAQMSPFLATSIQKKMGDVILTWTLGLIK
jgi:hypothetical protein